MPQPQTTSVFTRASNYCDCFGVSHCFRQGYESDDDEAHDNDAVGLSHVGTAAYACLRKKHTWHHHTLWNVTSGNVVALDQTPKQAFTGERVTDGHSNWLPHKMSEIIGRTEVWCDVLSLAPPDGLFMESIKATLHKLHEKDKEIHVRMMFGNIVGMPVNCTSVLRQLTDGIPPDSTKLRVWVGAWRKGVSWNHAKIIAVDGRYLHTGGHNMWDGHYLQFDPVHDLSLELEGRVANDGHMYANEQWRFVEMMQRSFIGFIVDKLPDSFPMALKSRVTVSEFPHKVASVFPPQYERLLVPRVAQRHGVQHHRTPMITMGRYGNLTSFKRRPSDDAIIAMFSSAKRIIHLALQDLGPVCIPGTKVPLPGCVWPKAYLSALGRVIWERGVDVEIVLSNPASIPGGLKPTEACYGNGWTCVDVAAEIIKTIREQFPEADDAALRKKVMDNLRVSFLRGSAHGQHWDDGMTMALHSKHFIVDDVCCYIGSQNLYICDLAEWGVVIDSAEETKKIMDKYWNPMWYASYNADDCNVQEVMDGLDIDRDGEDPGHVSEATQKLLDSANQKGNRVLMQSGKQGSIVRPSANDCFYATDVDESEGAY